MTEDYCACGQPLHYATSQLRAAVEQQIQAAGSPTVLVRVGTRSWLVPRHFIALHNLKMEDLPDLAQRYGFEELQ